MTRRHLQWSNLRPTLLRAVGRSGAEYRLRHCAEGGWSLLRFAHPDDTGDALLHHGALADMKALAELAEADALGPAPAAQRIAWTRLRPGHYWGIAPIGLAYRILKIGITESATLWRLEQFPNEDAETGAVLDEGPLQSLKRRAEEDATEAARAAREAA